MTFFGGLFRSFSFYSFLIRKRGDSHHHYFNFFCFYLQYPLPDHSRHPLRGMGGGIESWMGKGKGEEGLDRG